MHNIGEHLLEGYTTMKLVNLLKTEAIKRGLLVFGTEIDLKTAFELVRDMPYERANDRLPETIICEWRGTCSGKHYLLRDLFAELGYRSRVMACTSEAFIPQEQLPPELQSKWQACKGRFVDVHNYLILEHPAGEMIVDATWPLEAASKEMIVNDQFVFGQDQKIASNCLQTYEIPADQDPQTFKQQLLQTHFNSDELVFREAIIHALSQWVQEPDEEP